MTPSKTVLLPLTKCATLQATLLQAVAAHGSSHGDQRIAFRIARSPDLPVAEQLAVQRLRQTHASLFSEASDFVVDFAKPADVREAMDGCRGVVVATALSDDHAFDMEMNMVEAARASGSVQDVLKVSCPQGILGENSSVAIGAQHWHIEQRVKQLRFEGRVQFVRANTLMDTLLQGKLLDMICGRALSVSVQHGRVAMVHPLDVADVLRVLLHKTVNAMGVPETYDVTGPEALSFQEIADQLSTGIGQRVTYSYFPLWAVQPSMWIRGDRPEAIAREIQMARAIEAGAERDVLTTVEDIVARQPHTLRQFIKEHDGSWPLRAYK